MKLLNRPVILLMFLLAVAGHSLAQKARTADEEADYTKTINERAEKIVKTLNIADADKTLRVRDIIAGQYRSLSTIHDAGDLRIKAAKEQPSSTAEKIKEEVSSIESETDSSLSQLHAGYIAKLSAELTPEQTGMVKNGMTYNVLPITYKGYQEMLPGLTGEQKKQIMTWLEEAREHAMDAGTSEKKHWWFGKYKGRINNYLAAAGYDLKKAGADWEARRKAGEKR
jgi:hypothetical protein